MDLADIKIGQWYASNNKDQPNYHFKASKIDVLSKKVKVLKVGRWKHQPAGYGEMSNPDYWRNATPVNYSDIEHLIPDEFKENKEIEPLLFN